jgi:sugar/nucleoside kinase (ribokinase family)
MGKKTQAAKASLVAAFVAAGGAAATQARAAANPDEASLNGIISSYFGPLGVRDDFQQYMKESSGFQNFDKWFKYDSQGATRGVIAFSSAFKIAPPPGFTDDGNPGL